MEFKFCFRVRPLGALRSAHPTPITFFPPSIFQGGLNERRWGGAEVGARLGAVLSRPGEPPLPTFTSLPFS